MGQRLLRDWTKSEKVDKLSATAEVLFTRLIMKADDFGIYHANLKLIKADCFPLREDLKSIDLEPYMSELIKADLIYCYKADDGREYLIIKEFGQRLRAKKSKYPQPKNLDSANFGTENEATLRTNDDNCPLEEKGSRSRIEIEREKEMFFLDLFNSTMERKFKVLCDKGKRQLHKLIKLGYNSNDFKKAMLTAKSDEYHVKTKGKYLTPEFITRQDKFERFLHQQNEPTDITPKRQRKNG